MRRVRRTLASLVALAAFATPLVAQQGTVGGVVVSAASGAPIPGTQIFVTGTTLGTSTDANGRFRLGGLTGDSVSLSIRRIGFAAAARMARVGDLNLRIAINERALELSQVVVTGTAGNAEKKAIGNAVTTVQASDIVATQPVRTFQELLTGRAAGVSVIGSSGQVGSGSRIRVRGASSLSLNNDPLIYVDGVRVDNTQASGPTSQAFGSAPISRWNDFDPDDIESIEVIKGPAAATLYGTEASNGVVQIVTKRGSAGRPVWSFGTRLGANSIPGWKDRFFTNYGTIPRAGSATGLDTVTLNVRQLNDSLNSNFGNDIFRTGMLQEYNASVSGGSAAARYYVGGNYEENQGVEKANRLNRGTLRANVTITPSDKWSVQSSMGYTGGRTYVPYESGGGGLTWATYFASPGFLYRGRNSGNPQLGFRSGPPNIYWEAYNIFQDANRFTGSTQINHSPVKWFNHRLIVGIDRLSENNHDQGQRNDDLAAKYASFSSVGGTTQGYVAIGTRDVTYNTVDYSANATYTFGNWTSTSSAGGQYYARRSVVRAFSGTGFPASGLISLRAAAIQRTDQDDVFDNNTIGGFLQEQVSWNDRLFLTAALRADDNSAFGTNFPVVKYPKFSASYVLSEEPGIKLPSWVNTLRVRGAFGGSGLQPGAFDAIRTYNSVGGVVTPANAGNADLGPEKSYETELGLDAGIVDDRYGVELTYFNGYTKDAILSRQAPPSAGFPGLQFFNAGQVDRHGLEWLVRAQPIRGNKLTLDLALSGSTNAYKIKDMGGNERVSLSGQIQHVVGYAPGAWWDRKVVKADKDANNRAINLQCDDGKGGTVACASAPRVFLGNSVPTYEGSFTTGLTLWQNLRINAFVDWRGGYKKLDGNRRVRCNLFSLCRENYYPSEFDAVTLAEVQGGTAYTYNLIQDASFLRFRELSASYALPGRFASYFRATRASFTVAGRNLGMSTKYKGIDPEASFNGGSRGGAFGQWEQNVLPQVRQLVTTISLNY